MISVAHIVDESAGWEHRVALEPLLDRLPPDTFHQHLASVDRAAVSTLNVPPSAVTLIPRRFALNALAAPRLRELVARRRIDLIHAWGTSAAVAARAACDQPLVITLFDPAAARRDVKIMRTLVTSGSCAIVATTQTVRRRLIEGGLAPDRMVVIRPGVDFSKINAFRRGDLRARLNVPTDARLVALVPPVTRNDGQFDAALAVSILNHVHGSHRAALPETSREAQRILRCHRTLPTENVLIPVGKEIPLEELIAVSDVLVVAARDDVPTAAIAWAMASNTAVVGAAGYAVAELIANKVNGLLFKQTPGQSMTASIASRLGDRASLDRAAEVARGQAYEVFGLRRFVEDHARLYQNLLANRGPGDGIVDAAGVA